MFNGMPARVVTAMVICAQIASMFLAITIPVPQSLAREPKVQLEACDIPAERYLAARQAAGVDAEPDAPLAAESVDETVADEVLSSAADGFAVAADIEPAYYGGGEAASPAGSSGAYGADELRTQGVIFDGGYRYTWYSQRVLPGGGLAIDGRHVSDEGYVVDADGRIVVASSDLPKGTEIDVPFGSGKAVVLDTGCAPGTVDVYTDF